MEDCLFCKIVASEIPATIVYRDDDIVAFEDIVPQAPTHILIVPNQHISTLNDISKSHHLLIGHIINKAADIAKSLGHANDGYRLVFNCNAAAGQTVFHIHCHMLAGRELAWPPG